MQPTEPRPFARRQPYFFYGILLICLSYLIAEYFFIPYGALSADEFVFARHIYEYTFHVPYRDFAPYKTVLGYYLLSLPFFFSHTLFGPLFYAKGEIALLNVGFIALTAYWSSRFFNQKAILLTLLAIIANQLFLVYATDLRVDMLTSWVSLAAALGVLQYRSWLGGCLVGMAFLISQKALWYVAALNGALALCALLPYSRYSFRFLIQFNVAAALPILLYISGYSAIASPRLVLYNLFYEAYIQAGIDWYMPIFWRCWQAILYHGPLLFLLWPLTFLILFKKPIKKPIEQSIFILTFSSIALLLFITYKQPFPYNAVFTVPAFFLLYADFISWLLTLPKYSAGKSLFFTLFITLGILYPFYTSWQTCRLLDGHYQQTMLKTVTHLLQPGEDYVAGIPFLYQQDQPIDGMKNLIGPAIDYLYSPTDKLRPLLLPSLYLSPTSPPKILAEFDKMSVKIIINNYRLLYLPPAIVNYIKNNYQHLYGSIYLYAPTIAPSQLTFYLKFTGSYRLQAKISVIIDGKRKQPGQIISLKKGDHTTHADENYRLVLIPDRDRSLPVFDSQYQQDKYFYMLKAIVV